MAKKKTDKELNYRYRLGQNIARIRKQETGYTQEDMEIYTGVSRAYYGRIELGIHAASINVLIKIADALNVPLYRLFLDENERPIWLIANNIWIIPFPKKSDEKVFFHSRN